MITKQVAVTTVIEVTVDETKFDEAFMTEFRQQMYHFTSLDAHMEHLAQMHARGLYDDTDFIEGYGRAKDMGIKLNLVRRSVETEVLREEVAA